MTVLRKANGIKKRDRHGSDVRNKGSALKSLSTFTTSALLLFLGKQIQNISHDFLTCIARINYYDWLKYQIQ